MNRDDTEERIEHRFRTIEKLLRTRAQGMAALHVEQQQKQTVVTQLVKTVNGVDALTSIAHGVADWYENTLRDIGER